MHKLNQWITKPWAINTIYLVEMVKEIHTWRHRHQSVPDTSEDTATKVCQIQVKTTPPTYARYKRRHRHQSVLHTQKQRSRHQSVPDSHKWRHFHQNLPVTHKWRHRHESVPNTHKWRHRHQSVLRTHEQVTATKVFQIITSENTATI